MPSGRKGQCAVVSWECTEGSAHSCIKDGCSHLRLMFFLCSCSHKGNTNHNSGGKEVH